MQQSDSAVPLNYSADRSSAARRLILLVRRRKRTLGITFCLLGLLLLAAPLALVQYGKHKWNVALASSPGPGKWCVARFDGFVLGGDHLISAWAIRYKLVPPGQADGFEAYLFLSPRFLEIDAPIFHS